MVVTLFPTAEVRTVGILQAGGHRTSLRQHCLKAPSLRRRHELKMPMSTRQEALENTQIQRRTLKEAEGLNQDPQRVRNPFQEDEHELEHMVQVEGLRTGDRALMHRIREASEAGSHTDSGKLPEAGLLR